LFIELIQTKDVSKFQTGTQ